MRRLIALFLALPLLCFAAGPSVAPFAPNSAATVTVAATTVSGSTRVALVGGGPHLLIQSAGTVTAFCEFGTSTVTAATATGLPVQSGVVFTITKPAGSTTTHVACITASSTATIYVTSGDGE